jgi:hypothetical protein
MSRSDRPTADPVPFDVAAPRRNFQALGWVVGWGSPVAGGVGRGAGLVNWVGYWQATEEEERVLWLT